MDLQHAVEDFELLRSDLSPKTMYGYRRYLRLLVGWLGDTDADSLTRRDLQRFMAYMSDTYRAKHGGPLSQTGLHNCWTSIKSFCKWYAETYGGDNAADGLKAPKVPMPVVVPYTRQEVQALIEACYKSKLAASSKRRSWRYNRPEAYRDVAILLVLLDTGMRIGEAHRLDVVDIGLRERELEVKPHLSGRKSRPRILPFTRDTQAALMRYFAKRKEDGEAVTRDNELFPDSPMWINMAGENVGQRIKVRAVQHMLARLGDRAGVEKCHAHRFRHTFAIEYLRNGGDPFTLQYLLGHSSMEMVRRYLHFAKQDYKESHARASAVARWRLYIPKR